MPEVGLHELEAGHAAAWPVVHKVSSHWGMDGCVRNVMEASVELATVPPALSRSQWGGVGMLHIYNNSMLPAYLLTLTSVHRTRPQRLAS